ncbi:nucleotidyltransferase family protein [Litorimonas sp. WD9-15]|uniref:nucleotidyltransferase family protein n=1 Tax=Litorimonas sp. WD9-15 TaxID=3418716 RepID=UPI003D083568
MIETAMVMAAGHGTRMRPLTNDRAKAMVEVGGRPLIDHMLDRLEVAGVRRAIVNVHAHADHLEAHLKTLTSGPEIIISDERNELLETGGGVVKALPLLGDDPILICNIDAIWEETGAPVIPSLIKRWSPEIMDDLLLLAPKDRTLGYDGEGDFLFNYDGRLDWRGERDSAPYVYAGVQIMNLKHLRKEPMVPFTRKKVWYKTVADGTAYGHPLDGFWMHVGDPQARDAAEARLKDKET